jgi:Tol biopolymer transport system component
MNIDGSDQLSLTDIPGNAEPPKISPDGLTLEFSWSRDSDRVVGRVPISGGTVEEIPLPPSVPNLSAYYWAISPDGKKIAHTFRDEAAGRTRVTVEDIASGATDAILDIWPVEIFKWLPDGSGLFYKEREEGERLASKVNQIDLVRRTPRLLISVEPDVVSDLSYSFDAKQIALVRGAGVSNVVLLSARTE